MPKNSVKLWTCCNCRMSGMAVKSSTTCPNCSHYRCTDCVAYKSKNESTYSTSSYAEPPREHSSGWGSSSYYAPAPQPATPQPAISTFPTLSDETPYQKQSVTSSKSEEVVEGAGSWTARSGDTDVLELEFKQLQEALSDETPYHKPSTAISNAMANLASSGSKLGQYEEAKETKIQVLELHKEVLGLRHPGTIQAMENLASSWRDLGRYEEAKETELQVLELRKENLGPKHPYTIKAMANLAGSWSDLGRYEEAEEIELQVLKLRKEILGPKHPDTIKALANLGGSWSDLGRYEEAEAVDMEVLELRKEVLGVKHPDTIAAMASLAVTWTKLGRYEEAKEIEIQVLELQNEILGPRHPDTMLAMKNLAWTWHYLEKYKESELLMSGAAELYKQVLGPEHSETLRAMGDLSSMQKEREKRDRQITEDPFDDHNAMSESKEHVRSRSDSTSTSSFDLVEKPSILVEDSGAPSGIDVPSSSNLRHRAGVQAPALQEPANVVDKGKGKAPERSPSRDRDLERGPSQSSSSGASKQQTPPASENEHRENPGDPDPDEPASSTSSRLPKRSPLWLIWAIIICITLGLIAFGVLIFALARALTAEASPNSCATARRHVGDHDFLFALQNCLWQVIAILTGLMPACIHAHRYHKWMRMNVAWISAVICLAMVIASVPLYVTSPAISTALASGSNAPLCVFIFFAAYEPYREERWKVEVEMRTPPRGRVENGVLRWERRDE